MKKDTSFLKLLERYEQILDPKSFDEFIKRIQKQFDEEMKQEQNDSFVGLLNRVKSQRKEEDALFNKLLNGERHTSSKVIDDKMIEEINKLGIEDEEKKELIEQYKKDVDEEKRKPEANKPIPDDDSLEKVMEELNELIGLDEVKKSINDLVNLLKVEKIRSEKGITNISISLHTCFIGFPGTGKTTVARLLGRIFKHLGYLKKGTLVESDRSSLVAGFVGQTAIKVNDVVDKSLDGVLFIDEAYSLSNGGENDFGREAIDTLIKRMEDSRQNLVVIVAGYNNPMKKFIDSNPGLSSRFNRFFSFDHFTPEQLFKVYESFCKKSDFILSDDAKEKLNKIFTLLYERRNDSFGNARTVRNIFEKCIQNQANRIVLLPSLNTQSKEILQSITAVDIPEPEETVKQVYFTTSK